MNGWPATAARVLRSLRICSICFNRMTAVRYQRATHRLSRAALLTVDLAQYLESKNFALAFGILTSKPRQPYASEGS